MKLVLGGLTSVISIALSTVNLQFQGHLLGIGAKPQTPKWIGGILADKVERGRERGGKEKWRQDRTSAPEGERGEGKHSHTWRGPLMARGSAGTERDLWGIGG